MPILNIICIVLIFSAFMTYCWWEETYGIGKIRREIMEKVNKIENNYKK